MQIAPPEFHFARHARVREDLRAASLDALIVTSLPNLAYLTGLSFATAGAAIVSRERLALLVDGRYVATAKARQQMLDGIDLVMVPQSGSYEEAIAAVAGTFSNGRVGFEDGHMTVRQHRDLSARVAAIDSKIEMTATTGMVERCRAVKDAGSSRRFVTLPADFPMPLSAYNPKSLSGTAGAAGGRRHRRGAPSRRVR